MDDQNRLDTLDTNNTDNDVPNDQDESGEGVIIPSRIRDAVDDVRQRIEADTDQGRDVVGEYEDRYYNRDSSHLETPPEDDIPGQYISRKDKRITLSVSDNERKWAALAHASTLLTVLGAIASAGLGVLITMCIPLLIYFSFRKRSEFVAFHALQAFTAQLIGTIGWLALIVVGTITWAILLIISVFLILVVVGIVLIVVLAIAYPFFFLASLALPLGMVIYSLVAAVETWKGHNYRIPYVAGWVESQMYSSEYKIF